MVVVSDKWHDLLTEEVKEWYRQQQGMNVPDWYASYKARLAFMMF